MQDGLLRWFAKVGMIRRAMWPNSEGLGPGLPCALGDLAVAARDSISVRIRAIGTISNNNINIGWNDM